MVNVCPPDGAIFDISRKHGRRRFVYFSARMPLPEHPPPAGDAFQPYAPPAHEAQAPLEPAEGAVPDRSVRLFTVRHMVLATFLGTALGGAVVYAINERRLGHPQAAVRAVAYGVLAAMATLGIGFAIPSNIVSVPLGLAPLFGVNAVARKYQGRRIRAHLSGGGGQASGWAAAGIGLLCLMVLMVPFFAIAVAVGLAMGG